MKCQHRTKSARRRTGYILLSVLVGLMIAGLLLASLAQFSLRLANEAIDREQRLQARWAAISCERTVMPLAEQIFATSDELALTLEKSPASQIDFRFQFGGQTLEMQLQDEHAKVDLNSVFHHGGRYAVERIVKRQTAGQGRVQIRLRPIVERVDPVDYLQEGNSLPLALSTWGQVFDLPRSRPPGLGSSGQANALRQWTQNITLTRSGRLNVRRASVDAIREVCGLVVSDGVATRIARRHREVPEHPIMLIVNQMGVDSADQVLLEQLLSNQSGCYSGWISVFSDQILEQRQIVAELDDEGVMRTSVTIF